MKLFKIFGIVIIALLCSLVVEAQTSNSIKGPKSNHLSEVAILNENKIFDVKPLSVQDIVALLSFLVLITGTIYAYNQYKESKKSRIQANFIKTVEYLQDNDFVKARHHIQSKLKTKPFHEWNDEDINFAEIVCRKYDTVCLMNERLNMGSNLSEISTKWQHSIKNCYQICKPLIEKYQIERDKYFWNHFSKLNELASKSNSNTDTLN